MQGIDRLNSNRSLCNIVIGFLIFMILMVSAVARADEDATPVAKDESPRASLYYPDLEPKQLFRMLSEIYHIQFEGVDTVTGPISLISKESEMVDVNGMLELLNEVLSEQNKVTVRDKGQIIRIVPVLDTESKWIELKYANPNKVAEFLNDLYFRRHEGSDTPPPLKVLKVHPELPRIYLVGPKEVLAEIETLVKTELDVESAAPAKNEAEGTKQPPDNHVKEWVNIEHTSIDKVIQFLKDLYGVAPGREHVLTEITRHPDQSRVLLVGERSVVEEAVGLVKEDIDIAPPPPPPPPPPPIKMKYLALNYIDSVEFQKIMANDHRLEDKFNSAIAPNNTLIVSTRDESIFPRIEELQKTFDVDRMEIRYYPLSNADATDIAKMLQDIYPEQAEALPEELSRIRRETLSAQGDSQGLPLDAQLAEALRQVRAGNLGTDVEELLSQSITIVGKGELTVIADKVRNGLLIRTFSRNFPKILELIAALDKPSDQVMIDVFITEVRLDDATELGVDFTYAGDMTHRNRNYTIGQDLGASNSALGLSYQLVSDNINAYIRALQQTGKLDVITRPQVLTQNNNAARIALGRKVPLIEKTTVSTEGAVNSTVRYDDVLTELKVTPKIHPDGYVTLQIDQTIDDISTETFQISKDFNPQVIIKRQASTLLRIKDGQTVCLGGFIGDSILDTATRVPILSDIPLLGELFKYRETQRIKTELIIFITPHILSTPQELLRMTNHHRDISRINRNDERASDVMTPQTELVYPSFADPIEGLNPEELPVMVPDIDIEVVPDSQTEETTPAVTEDAGSNEEMAEEKAAEPAPENKE